MIIQKALITKFRGFENVEFNLGNHITVISGKNGTQKTTILGILSQPFAFSVDENPMKDEKPLCGGNFRSAFGEKFKFSENFDKPKDHEWTLFLKDQEPFVVESISRAGNEAKGIRFWKKGDRSKGSGYIQLPVIYLSLKRLMPIGEDIRLSERKIAGFTPAESTFFTDWHDRILISLDKITNTNYLVSPDKTTIGVNTEIYDWKQNSAGQDNIGKILLAIMSFKRLKEKYPEHYKGGILVIDELDATIYPGSQIKLFDALRKFSSQFKIQIIFTTHSLSLLEYVCKIQEKNKKTASIKDQVIVHYLEKKNSKVELIQNVTYETIKHRLNVTIGKKGRKKIIAFTEDNEGLIFTKALLKQKANNLNFIKCSLGCKNFIQLTVQKVPPFIFPDSIIFLDGDVKLDHVSLNKIKKFRNYVILPGENSPERLIAEFLFGLDDKSEVWQKVNVDFNKEVCFRDYRLEDIQKERKFAKEWFNSLLEHFGRNAAKVIGPWIKANPSVSNKFVEEFLIVYNKIAKELAIDCL